MVNMKKVYEDAVVAAGGEAGGGEVVSGAGVSANDVLGHCDHSTSGGFLDDQHSCFHIPSKCKVPFRRHEICNGGGKKKKKTFYDKGMKILTDSELTRSMILSLHKVPEETIAAFIQRSHKEIEKVKVDAIMYHPVSTKLFAKVRCAGRTYFSMFDFDEAKKKFINTDGHRYTPAEAKKKFEEILGMEGNTPNNVGSDDMKLWCIWGAV